MDAEDELYELFEVGDKETEPAPRSQRSTRSKNDSSSRTAGRYVDAGAENHDETDDDDSEYTEKPRGGGASSGGSGKRKSRTGDRGSIKDTPGSVRKTAAAAIERPEYRADGYIDDAEMEKMMKLTEVERERIITDRLERMAMWKEINELEERNKRVAAATSASAGKQQEKAHKLQKSSAKRSRRQRDEESDYDNEDEDDDAYSDADEHYERSRHKSRRGGDDSYYDDDDDEARYDERRRDRHSRRSGAPSKPIEYASYDELRNIIIVRGDLERWVFLSHFEKVVIGSLVRICLGNDGPDLLLRYGSSVKPYKMDIVSNSPPEESEFARWAATMTADGVNLIGKQTAERKSTQIRTARNYKITDADVAKMIEAKQKLVKRTNPVLEKANLMKERQFAMQDGRMDEIIRIDNEIQRLERLINEYASASSARAGSQGSAIPRRIMPVKRLSDIQFDKMKFKLPTTTAGSAAARAAVKPTQLLLSPTAYKSVQTIMANFPATQPATDTPRFLSPLERAFASQPFGIALLTPSAKPV
ncbi:hypothetical protein GQ42DRAFT_179529 [Ramicandelaber brevisporus]|nr:hypothetical protein GQ42DRAFT_179529 [Ramicandelaber brevisporus]